MEKDIFVLTSNPHIRIIANMQDLVKACKRIKTLGGKSDSAQEVVLRELRTWSAESSQAAISNALGFSRAYINDVIQGRRRISAEFVRRVIAMDTVSKEECA